MSQTGADKAGKGGGKALLRIGVSFAILLVITMFVPVGELFDRIRQISPTLWLAVFGGFLAGHAISAAKWRWMIGGAVSYPRALKAHFAGLAANLALPGVAGGDLVRAGMVMKGSDRKTALAIGSLAERLIDTAALLIVAAAGAFWLGARAGVDPNGLGVASAVMIATGVAGVIFMKSIGAMLKKVPLSGKPGALLHDAADAMVELASRRGVIVACAIVSIFVQFAFALMNGLIAQNLGAGTSLAAWVFAWPLAKLVATLPISFGGVGVREASIAGLMTPLGYAAAGVVAASLVWQSIQIAAGLLGGAVQGFGAARAPGEGVDG